MLASLELDSNNGWILSYIGRTLKGWERIKDALENYSTVLTNRSQSTQETQTTIR